MDMIQKFAGHTNIDGLARRQEALFGEQQTGRSILEGLP